MTYVEFRKIKLVSGHGEKLTVIHGALCPGGLVSLLARVIPSLMMPVGSRVTLRPTRCGPPTSAVGGPRRVIAGYRRQSQRASGGRKEYRFRKAGRQATIQAA